MVLKHFVYPPLRGGRGRKITFLNICVHTIVPKGVRGRKILLSLSVEKAIKQNLWHYNTHLKQFARQNRNDMTKAEACIWKYLLSKRQMNGFSFRRQRPILNYIADFMCKELMLIIEVDGLTHHWEGAYEKDLLRQQELEKVGFTVLRFHDDEVLNDIENVRREILKYIGGYNVKV